MSRTPPLQSPAQLALIGGGLWLLALLIHPLGILGPLGVILLIGAGVAYLLRPRRQTMYWRGRVLDLDGPPNATERLYHTVFRD